MSPRVRELTAPARGAVSVLEVRGPDAVEAVEPLVERALPRPGELGLVRLFDGDELLDEALCVRPHGDRIELHLHGSPWVVERVKRLVGGAGPGTRRPDTLEDRAREALVEATSEAAARVLLDQTEGALRRAFEALKPNDPSSREAALELACLGRKLQPLFEPPRVVLAGPVNAGKSTLFNLLVGHERVVVSREPGTTRDAICERVQLREWRIDLVDTAGERYAAVGIDPVEASGLDLSRELRNSADLVLWLVSASTPPGEGPLDVSLLWIPILTQTDLQASDPAPFPDVASISVLADPTRARQVVERAVIEALDLPEDPWIAGRAVPFDSEQIELLRSFAGEEQPKKRLVLRELLLSR